MENAGIRLSPPNLPRPKPSFIPRKRARRWRSPFDDVDGDAPLAVFMTQKAYIRVCVHAGSDLDHEVGGWLMGKWSIDEGEGREFIVVESVLPAGHTRQGSTFVTFTQDSQVDFYQRFERDYPGKILVGWYHTHPRMGVFLSQYDLWLHKYFFPHRWQVALVLDPHAHSAGFFMRDAQGELSHREHHGFYEIDNGTGRSVVHWRNLRERNQMRLDEEDWR